MRPKKLRCYTCGGRVDNLRRDVVDSYFNTLDKSARWNCGKYYEEKPAKHQRERGDV